MPLEIESLLTGQQEKELIMQRRSGRLLQKIRGNLRLAPQEEMFALMVVMGRTFSTPVAQTWIGKLAIADLFEFPDALGSLNQHREYSSNGKPEGEEPYKMKVDEVADDCQIPYKVVEETALTMATFLHIMQNLPPDGLNKGFFEEIVRNGERAEDRFYQCNFDLVRSMAIRFWHAREFQTSLGTTLPLDDLIQEGNIGLIKAVNKFNPFRGYKFSTMAYRWIDQEMRRANQQWDLINMSVFMKERCEKLAKFTGRFVVEQGRNPTLAEVASQMDISIAVAEDLLRYYNIECLSLDDEKYSIDRDHTLGDIVADDDVQVETEAVDNVAKLELTEAIKGVTGTMVKEIGDSVSSYFGLINGEGQTLRQVGEKFGVSGEAIRLRLTEKAYPRLREALKNYETSGYI